MIVVAKEDFHAVKEKVKGAPTFVYSILDTIINGVMYASSTDLETLLIKTESGLYYVTGTLPDENFLEHLGSMFEVTVREGKRFTLFATSESWCKVIEELLGERVRRIERYSFTFERVAKQNRNMHHTHDIEKINQDHIEHSLEFDEAYYDEYWDSTSNFLQNGFGFCVKENNQIISEGVSIFRSVDYAEIDIITDPNYRGIGLASIVANTFIAWCLSNNIQPRWDCVIDNQASIQLGYNLGFNNPKEYAVYVKRSFIVE